MICPKCEGFFPLNVAWKWCEFHQNEYDEWNNDKYEIDVNCQKCGSCRWTNSFIQMTEPPTYPEMPIYRCEICNEPRMERSKTRIRFIERNDDY